MKMQNASMEFVTFDAQDVIMTSGVPMAWFKVTQDLVPGSTGYGNGNWTISDKNLTLLLEGKTAYTNTYVQLTGGVSGYSYDKEHNAYDITGVTTGTTEETELGLLLPVKFTDIAAIDDTNTIIGWLNQFGKKQPQ